MAVQGTLFDIKMTRIMGVYKELFPSILGNILGKQLAPKEVAEICKNLGKTFTRQEIKNIYKFSRKDTFDDFDFGLLYKVIRNISTTNPQLLLIDPPTKGWGNRADNGIETFGDALEEMHFLRNTYTHERIIIVSDEEFEEVWQRFIAICSFLENGGRLNDRLKEYLTHDIIDDQSEERLKETETENYYLRASIAVGGGILAFYRAYSEKREENGHNSPPKYSSCDSPNATAHTTERGKTTKVEWEPVTAVDAEDGPITPERIGEPSGSSFRNGTHTIVYLATDSGGLEKTCRINFSVQESSIRCEKEGMDHFLPNGKNDEMLTWDISSLYSTTDVVPPRVEQIYGLPPGSPFPRGSHDIVYKITDSKGVSVNCSFTFNVFGYGVRDPNNEKMIADITSKGQIIKEGVAIREVEKQNMTEIAAKLKYRFPEMSPKFQKWTKENYSSTHASPFSKWVTQERYPQCKPEDAPVPKEPKNKEAIEEDVKKWDNSKSPYPDIQHNTPRNRLRGGGGPGGGGLGQGGGQGGGPRGRPGEGPREGGPGCGPREVGPGAHGGIGGNDGGRGHGDGCGNDNGGGGHGGDEGAGGQGSGFGGGREGGEGFKDCHSRNTDHGGCDGKDSTSNNYQNSEDGKCGINIIDGKTFNKLYPENRGWNEAPIPRRRISCKPKESDHWHTRSYDCLQNRFPNNVTKTTEREGSPCNICQVPVEDAYVYKAPSREFLFHGKCIAHFTGG